MNSEQFQSNSKVARQRQPRYLVEPGANLMVSAPQGLLRNHPISTIGYGGFGIYCTHKESKLIKMSEVEFTTVVSGEKFSVRGKVQYFKCVPQLKPYAYYVGFQIEPEPSKQRLWRQLVDEASEKGLLRK